MSNNPVASIGESIIRISNEFKFNESTTFVADGKFMLSICVAYLLGVLGLQRFMEKKNPVRLKLSIALHNGFLSICSLGLLVLIGTELIPKIFKKGYYGSVCDRDVLTNRLEFYCYLNYLLKFYELIDTFFMVAKKKDIPYLHIYHHTMTLILTHVELVGFVTVQWVPISLNLFVHVFMYLYYMLATFGYEIWWKKYLTSLQIIQFIIDLFVCLSAISFYHFSGYTCSGDNWCAFAGVTIIGSYLFLFIDFFDKTYTNKTSNPTTNKPNPTTNKPNPNTNNHHKSPTKKNQ